MNDFIGELAEFRVEATELFNLAEESLLSLERGINVDHSKNDLLRCLHSIKGASGMFGLMNLQLYLHELESNILNFLSENNYSSWIDNALKALDEARLMLNGESIKESSNISKDSSENIKYQATTIDNYYIGLSDIDHQHKKVVDMIDKVRKGIVTKTSKETNLKVLRMLEFYVKAHFHYEEVLLRQGFCPNYEEHVNSHERFILDLKILSKEIEAGSNSGSIKMLGTLYNWFVEHIKGEDVDAFSRCRSNELF